MEEKSTLANSVQTLPCVIVISTNGLVIIDITNELCTRRVVRKQFLLEFNRHDVYEITLGFTVIKSCKR